MNSEVEEIKSRLNIVDVLSEYIHLEKAGANWRAICPFHHEKTPSFMVNEEKQIWHCFGCGKGGDIFSFVMEMEGLEFREALKMLAEKAGVKIKNYNPQKFEKKNRILEILELATKFWEIQLWKGMGKDKILDYLHQRGLQDETIKKFRLGYAPPGWRNMLKFLVKRGYKLEEIAKTGLLVNKGNASLQDNQTSQAYDRFRNRIIFPIADYAGKVVGFSARIVPGEDESQAKYINTPETEVYHKSRILYGMDKAKSEIKQKNWLLLVEGNMDVIATSQAGIENVVAVSGTALTEEQIGIIKRYTRHLKMFFDMDKAGEIATKKSVKICLAKEMDIQIVILPFGKDAAEIAKDNPEKLKEAVKKSLNVMEYFFQRVFKKFDKKKVEDKEKIAEELLDIIADLENAVEKEYWLKKLSEKLEISQTALTDSLKKLNLKKRIKKNKNFDKTNLTHSVIPVSKLETLTKELIGLMLVFPEVWKKALKEFQKENIFLENELLNSMLKNGEENNFDFDRFILSLGHKQKLRTEAEKLFFQKKYQLDLNNNLEEIIIGDPIETFQNYLKKIQKEKLKNKLIKLTYDLKTAEERKDQTAISFLRREFNEISKQLK